MAGTKSETTKEKAPETASAEPGPISFPLRKEVDAHGEKINKLTFREPSGADIERYGNPLIIDMSTEVPTVTFDERKMAAMLSALATVPLSTIRALSPRDWTTCAWGIAPFFMPDLRML